MTNIILISLDTTRADRLSCYGHFRRTSPHIDRVAEEGVRFQSFFSPHIPTFPGHTTMMSGLDVYAHQVTSQSAMPGPTDGLVMLAQRLQQAGFYTAAADNLGRWFAHGMEHVESYGWETPLPGYHRKGEAVLHAGIGVIDRAAAQDRPFFLFLHFWDPHTPYLPPAPFDRMFYTGDEKDPNIRTMDEVWRFENFRHYFAEWMPGVTDIEFPKAQYDASIAYMDACLAQLFEHLDSLSLTADTCLVITADHGEELDEHAHWFDHHGLYDTNLHVPLIVRCPALLPAGITINGLTQMPDLTPTLLDMLGLLDEETASQFTGRSMVPLIHSPAAVDRGSTDELHITENTWMKKRGIRTATWKLILPIEVPDLHGNSSPELYDLCADPMELNNLADQRPEVVRELAARVDEHVARRTSATGMADPLPIQPIPLRRIGRIETAVPSDPRLKGAAPGDAPASEDAAASADEKLPEGDFIGYEREEG